MNELLNTTPPHSVKDFCLFRWNANNHGGNNYLISSNSSYVALPLDEILTNTSNFILDTDSIVLPCDGIFLFTGVLRVLNSINSDIGSSKFVLYVALHLNDPQITGVRLDGTPITHFVDNYSFAFMAKKDDKFSIRVSKQSGNCYMRTFGATLTCL